MMRPGKIHVFDTHLRRLQVEHQRAVVAGDARRAAALKAVVRRHKGDLGEARAAGSHHYVTVEALRRGFYVLSLAHSMDSVDGSLVPLAHTEAR